MVRVTVSPQKDVRISLPNQDSAPRIFATAPLRGPQGEPGLPGRPPHLGHGPPSLELKATARPGESYIDVDTGDLWSLDGIIATNLTPGNISTTGPTASHIHFV
jgi:hypothetical protein